MGNNKDDLINRIFYNLDEADKSNLEHSLYLLYLLSHFKIVDSHIIVDDFSIFSNKKLIQALKKYYSYTPKVVKLVKSIIVKLNVSLIHDLDKIYSEITDNINDIHYFQEIFCIDTGIDLYLKVFNAKKTLRITEYILEHGFSNITFILNHPSTKQIKSIISNIDKFCTNNIIKNPKVRFDGFPFCFLPESKFRCNYRNFIDYNDLKGEIFLQKDTIKDILNKQFDYLKQCNQCRCKTGCYYFSGINNFHKYTTFLTPRCSTTVVFTGGSLQKGDYKKYFSEDILFTYPIEQGDMFMTIIEGFKNILIIDGYFYNTFPCTTFEVMLALEKGVNVFGSSSIGALRAIELDNYGMVGIGYVYNYLKNKHVKPYHIVAQTYDEQDMPATDPLINIIYFFEKAFSKKIINKKEFLECLKTANSIHFTQLSFEYMFHYFRKLKIISSKIIDDLKKYLSTEGVNCFDIKRKDALHLLGTFRELLEDRASEYVENMFNSTKEKNLCNMQSKYNKAKDLHLPIFWKNRSKKTDFSKTDNSRDNREFTSQQTNKLAEKFFEGLDIIIADTTKFDPSNTNILNIYFPLLYLLKFSFSCSTGNGDIYDEALASAYMELLERITMFFEVSSYKNENIDSDIFDIEKLPQYYNSATKPKIKKEIFYASGFVKVSEIITGKQVYIPRDIATFKFAGSDGNASGNTLPEAILYGIYELIERDTNRIYTMSLRSLKLKSKEMINTDDIQDERCLKIIRTLEQNGHKVIIHNLINIYGIPCIRCEIYDLTNKIKHRGGTVVRSNFNQALYSALNEAYMGYTIYFAGTRDDFTSLFTMSERNMIFKEEKKRFFGSNHFISIPTQPITFNSINEELEYTISKVIKAGIEHIFVADISPKDNFRLKSVKVIIPKMELLFIKPFKFSEFYNEKVTRTKLLVEKIYN